MAFEIGDRVKLRLSKDTMDRLNLVGAPIDNKIVTIGNPFYPTGAIESDIIKLKEFYEGTVGKVAKFT